MIFIKWIKYSGSDDPVTGACAPPLLIGNLLMAILQILLQFWKFYLVTDYF
jgi:hypothetical protein